MSNIFENAKFGDKFRTRDGKMVLYDQPTTFYKGWYWMVIQDRGTCRYFEDGHILISGEESPLDIIGKWEEPIDDEELDRLAVGFTPIELIPHHDVKDGKSLIKLLRECFKAGYRKALNK